MDKIEKMCQEIERRLNTLTNVYDELMERKDEEMMIYYHGKVIALEDLLSFLDTLSEEPDIPEFPETFEICLYDGRTPDNEKCTECSTTCSVRKEEPDKSLEEAAKQFVGYDMDTDNLRDYEVGIQAFIAGAEWQKSQMFKDAFVDNYVVHDGRIELEGDPLPSLDPILLLPYPQFEPGDKVRIIVIKAEEE